MKLNVINIKKLFSIKAAVVALIFGLLSMLTVLANIHVFLPGSIATTDPREVFISIGAAITGPIGAIFISISSTIFVSIPEYRIHIFLTHLLSSLWISFIYKKLFNKYDMPALAFFWVLAIAVYYFIAVELMNIIYYLFYPTVYHQIMDSLISSGQSRWTIFSEYWPEIIFTITITTLILIALPKKYRKPLWGISNKKMGNLGSKSIKENDKENVLRKNFLAVRVTLWFLILLSVSLIFLSIIIRNYYTDSILQDAAKEEYEKALRIEEDFSKTRNPPFSYPPSESKSVLLVVNDKFKIDSAYNDSKNVNLYSKLFNTKMIELLNGKSSGHYYDSHKLLAFGFAYVPDMNIYVISITDSDYLRARINNLVLFIIRDTSIALFIIAIIAGFIIWLIVGVPLKKITAAAVEIGKNNYNVKLDSDDMTDEVGVLAKSINLMNENIQTTQEMLSRILNSVPQSIFWKDKNSVYLGCNDVFVKATGIESRKNIIGKTDYELPWKQEEAAAYIADDQEVIKSGKSKYHIIEKLTDINGNHLWIDTTKIPLLDSKGSIYGILGVYEDITKRKLDEDALLISEIKFRTLFENANDAIFIMQKDQFIDCNTKSLEIFGCQTRDQIVGHPPYEFSPPLQPNNRSSKELALEKINEVLNGKPQFFEWTHTKYNGDHFFAEVSLNKINVDGNILLQAIVRDISERKRIESELFESRANLNALIESTSDLIWSVDKNYNLFTFNKTFFQHIKKNYGREAYVGAPSGSLLPTDRKETWIPLYEKALNEGPYNLEYNLPDGRILELSLHPIIRNAEIVGVSVFGKDITERINAELALKKSESHYRALAENTPDIIAEFDSEGRYIFINSVISRITNINPEEFIGKKISDMGGFSPEQAAYRERVIKKIFSDGNPVESEFEFEASNGSRIFEWRAYPILDANSKVQSVISINRDITQRKKEHEELIHNKTFIERINEQSPDIIYIYDVYLDRNIYTNKDIAEYLGYSKNELTSDDNDFFSKVIHPDDLRQFEKYYEKITNWKEEYLFEFEYRIKAKDGSWKWFRGKEKEFQRDDEGKIISLVGTVRDITQSKIAEESLKASEQRFKILTEATFEGIVIASERKFIDVNDQILQITGYSREEVINKNTIDFIAPESKEKFIELRDSPYAGPFEFIGLRKDGLRFPFEIRSKLMMIGDKEYRFSSIRDISDRKRSETALKNAISEIEFLINSLPIAIISIDNDMKVKQYNNKALAYKNDLTNIIGEGYLFDNFPAMTFIKSTLEKSLSQKSYISEERTIYDQNGDSKTFNITVIPLNNSISTGSVILVEDTTERRKMESLMIQSEKMVSVAGLAAGMAHEINNPLGTIVQGCQNIIRRTSTQLPKNSELANKLGIDISKIEEYFVQRQIYEIIDSMRNAASKASEIIKNMLQFSRRSESKKVLYSLAKLIDDSIELAYHDYDLKKKYDFRSIKLVKEIDDTVPMVKLTVTEIQQVLLNLLQNAAHALKIEPGKKHERTITIRLKKENKFAVVEIEDNGIGMDEKTRTRIFEPFFTTKEVGEGTGLGLSVSYMIITNNHQGIIAVESTKGIGTKFTINLPV